MAGENQASDPLTDPRHRRRRRTRITLVVIGVLLVLLVVGPFVAWGPPLAFDRAEWLRLEDPTGILFSHLPGGNNTRARMVDDLMADHLRLGMSKAEVEELLGRPSEAYGGGGSSTGGVWYDELYYPLLWMPRPDQKLVSRLKWGPADPRLIVSLEDGTVVSVRAGSR